MAMLLRHFFLYSCCYFIFFRLYLNGFPITEGMGVRTHRNGVYQPLLNFVDIRRRVDVGE